MSADKILGAVLGAAIGDAMGHPVEFQNLGPGQVHGYQLYWELDGKRFAPYTDDTQMAEVVLRSLLDGRDAREDLDVVMRRLADGFVAWSVDPQGGHRAPGNACLAGCRALQAGASWWSAGGEAAGGCGSVMRAYPVGLVFADDLRSAEVWAVAQSKLTHRDPIALAASAAMAVGTALALKGADPWSVAETMGAVADKYSPATGDMIRAAVRDADDDTPPGVTLDRLRGWAAHEAIAAAVYVFLRHADDPRAAILEAASTPGDSDSLATLAGALVGARCGASRLPRDWVSELERTDELQALAMRIQSERGE